MRTCKRLTYGTALLIEPKHKEFFLLSRVASVWCIFQDVEEDVRISKE